MIETVATYYQLPEKTIKIILATYIPIHIGKIIGTYTAKKQLL